MSGGLNLVLCASAAFMSVTVCFKVLVFEPKTTVPPITTAIAAIRTVGSNPSAPMIIAEIKIPPAAMATFEIKNDLQTPLYNIGELLSVGFDVQDLFVQVTRSTTSSYNCLSCRDLGQQMEASLERREGELQRERGTHFGSGTCPWRRDIPWRGGRICDGPLGEILEWRFHSALFLACDARLLQIKLALDAPARLVGNFALSEQLIDEFTLGGNQVRSKLRDSGSSFEPI